MSVYCEEHANTQQTPAVPIEFVAPVAPQRLCVARSAYQVPGIAHEIAYPFLSIMNTWYLAQPVVGSTW